MAPLLYFFNHAVGNIMITKGIGNCDAEIERVRRAVSELSELSDDWYLFVGYELLAGCQLYIVPFFGMIFDPLHCQVYYPPLRESLAQVSATPERQRKVGAIGTTQRCFQSAARFRSAGRL